MQFVSECRVKKSSVPWIDHNEIKVPYSTFGKGSLCGHRYHGQERSAQR